MNDQILHQNVKKVVVKDTLKLHGARESKVKAAVYKCIKDENVEIVSANQVFFNGKNQSMEGFAENLKTILEKTQNKDFPIFSVKDYISVLREFYAEENAIIAKQKANSFSNNYTEHQILNLVPSERLKYVKSHEQADEFLRHILFRLPDSINLVQVVARKTYDVKDEITGQILQRHKEIMLPGTKTLREYEETLKTMLVRSTSVDKQETYWDVFSRSKSILSATSVYNPYKELYWYDEYKHYYVNSYTEPEWKKEPGYFYLEQRHKNNPVTVDTLSDLLRSFLIHLFPDKGTLREVLKWCAFSTTDKLQTYLTLIGPQGIGKNILIDIFLQYYHGDSNFNKSKIIDKFNEKNAKSTLLFFDEKVMVTLEQYNEMKALINKSLSYEQKNKPVYMCQNFANIVWSCNTKDTMSGMSRDDRRFKIVPVATNKLYGAPIFDVNNKKIGVFTPTSVAKLTTSEEFKKEFVLLMLTIRDYVEISNESKDDINIVLENEARDAVLSESRSIIFTDITDVLKNVYNDYNEVTGRFGKEPTSKEEKDAWGVIYRDYIPLSELKIASDDSYTYRIPYGTIRKVIENKVSKQNPISFRRFNKEVDTMPTKYMRSITRRGQERDIEIKLEPDADIDFNEKLKPILLNIGTKKKKVEVETDDSKPFGDG
jgi:hypothetical protein